MVIAERRNGTRWMFHDGVEGRESVVVSALGREVGDTRSEKHIGIEEQQKIVTCAMDADVQTEGFVETWCWNIDLRDRPHDLIEQQRQFPWIRTAVNHDDLGVHVSEDGNVVAKCLVNFRAPEPWNDDRQGVPRHCRELLLRVEPTGIMRPFS